MLYLHSLIESSREVSANIIPVSKGGLRKDCLFDHSHSNRCEVISHCGFDLHFPDD